MSRLPCYSFDPDKNACLIKTRGISFEMIIAFIDKQGPLDVLEHPNSRKYYNQKLYVVELNEYAYLVPFVEQDNKIFLKTAFPSRKATKQYLKSKGA